MEAMDVQEREELRDRRGKTGRMLSLIKSRSWEREEGCLTSRVVSLVLG